MNATQTMVKMTFDRWHAQVKLFNNALEAMNDEQLQQEIAPGRNRGIYLLGHLTTVNDDMLPLLNFGSKLYPELTEPFLKSPDKTVAELPSAQALRTKWSTLNEALNRHFESQQAEDWLQRHMSVSAEDFAKEPHRNKLNIIVTRTTHMAYHTGQFILITQK